MSEPLIALFCGSREWNDPEPIRADLFQLHPDSVIIEGGQRGADRIARIEAYHQKLHVATVPALWDVFHRSAGYKRNAAMIRLRPDIVYAYPLGGPGTAMMIELAEKAGVPVIIREP